MSPIHPKSFTERDFPKAIRGYSIPEVDEYLDRVLENYTALYRENVELEKRLSEMQAKLDAASIDEANVRRTLQNAKKASEGIIEEAYVKADEILASIKADCDATLRAFRDKIEKEKKNLREIKESVAAFKDELFEKYRAHIELVEQTLMWTRSSQGSSARSPHSTVFPSKTSRRPNLSSSPETYRPRFLIMTMHVKSAAAFRL